MKRKLFGIILALTLAFTCFAVAACGNDGGKETPPGDPVTVELGYAEDTGVLSWNAVEGATKYIVRISNINDTAKSAETAETTLQLYLREGTSRIALIAEDAQGRELGNGSKIVELATDFGAPEKVSGLAYDKEAGALGWTAAEGAVKYLVSINSINNEQFAAVTNAETTSASYTVALEKGVYDVSVIAVNEHGAKSHASSYRYASYVDPAYGTEISEGVYKLFDFEDENVLDLARYKEILQGGWIKASKQPEWAVVNKHEKPKDRGEAATVDLPSKALKVRAPYKGENETDPYSSSVAFTLPEPLENWGRIYYDMFRTTNPPAGLVLTDVDGRRIIKYVEYNNGDTLEKWGTISFTKSELLASNSEFGAIAEIAFAQINTGGGVAYFDNVRFDMIDLGYFGESLYRRSTDTFTFDAVAGAQKYDMFVDGAETPIELTEPEYRFETALTTGNHSIKVVAYNGECSREHTYEFAVGEKIKFNKETSVGSGEYVLADFNTIEYREYIKTSARTDLGRYYNYTISDGKLNISHNEDWGNGNLIYTFPTEIQGAYIIKFNGVITSHPYFIGIIYKNSWTYTDDKDNEQSTNTESIYSSSALTATTDLTYSVPMDKRDNPIVGIKINACYANDAAGVAKTITLDSITYEKSVAVTNFNEKKNDSEEYLLADFTVNGYNDYITLENADYSISDNKLVVTSNKGWSGVSVKYTLPEAITGAGEIRIKVAASDQVRLFNVYFADGSKITSATPAKGAGTLVIPIPADKRSVAVTAVEVGAVNATDDKTRTVEVDEITYILYTAETEFNSSVADVENGKLLADFNANGYYDYLTIEGKTTWGNQPTKTIEGGALTMSLTATALNRYVRYTFASPINKDDILSLSFVAKSNTNYRVYVFDESGNSAYRDFVASENYATNANVLSGYKDYAKLTGKIVALGFASNYAECYVDGKATVLTVDRIAYEYCDKITGFNQLVSGSTTEYLLADFNVNGYKQNLKVDGEHYNWDGPQTTYAVKDGKLVIDKLVESGWNRVLKYTFPTAIKADDIAQITFKLTTTEAINIWLLDENGEKLVSDKLLTGACTELSSVPYVVSYELAGKNISAIALSLNNYQKQSVVSIDEITYEKNVAITNFNTLVEGTENEYLLADFSVSGYKQYLSNVGSGTYTLGENQITVKGVGWSTNYVKYTLPTSINVSDIEQIKVTVIQPASGKHAVLGVIDNATTPNMQGANNYQPFTLTINTETITGDKIVALYLSGNDSATPVTFTKITYIKKTA